jgi:hypothetical protein
VPVDAVVSDCGLASEAWTASAGKYCTWIVSATVPDPHIKVFTPVHHVPMNVLKLFEYESRVVCCMGTVVSVALIHSEKLHDCVPWIWPRNVNLTMSSAVGIVISLGAKVAPGAYQRVLTLIRCLGNVRFSLRLSIKTKRAGESRKQ